MSFANASLLIQQYVSRYGNRDRSWETINYVMNLSSANRKVTLDPNTFLKGPGKLRQVRLNWFPIQCDVLGDCNDGLCDEGEKVEPRQMMFAIDKCIASKRVTVELDDIRLTDNGDWDVPEVAMEIITGMLPQLRKEVALEWETLLYSMAGVHLNGNVTQRVNPVQNDSGVINPIALSQIRKEYQDGGFMEPFILGGDDIYFLKEMVSIGGLNAQGQVISRVNLDEVYYDNGLGTQILDDEANGGWIFSASPETFKYVWYSENAGIFRTDMASIGDLGKIFARGVDGFIKGVFIDPITGMMWDLYVNFDKCDQVWTIQLKHRYNFFLMPDVACNAEGVNGMMKWRTCPFVQTACPEGSPIEPSELLTYSWTPVLADIPLIYQSLIGGVGVIQNTPVDINNTVATVAAYMTDNSNITFTVNGADIEYEGYTAISGNFNNGAVTFTFAV